MGGGAPPTPFFSVQLSFANKVAEARDVSLIREEARLPAVSSTILFEIFPFIIVFGEDMVILTIGRSLTQASVPRVVTDDVSVCHGHPYH